MPNQRDKNKKLVGFFATDEEKKLIQEAAKKHGLTVAGFIRAVATGQLKVSNHLKVIVLGAAAGSQNGGCGPLFCLLILAAVAALAFA